MSVSTMGQASGPTAVFEIPYFETVEACNGELVDLEGTVFITSHQTNPQGGLVSATGTNTIKAEGFGDDTGARYILRAHASFGVIFDLDDLTPDISTQVFRFKMIGRGNVPDTTIKFFLHLTVNANGDLSVFRIDFSEECGP